MMTKREMCLNAHYSSQQILEHVILGHWNEQYGDYHYEQACTYLAKAADALGFDLVKRQTDQECNDAALARRIAEDGGRMSENVGDSQ